MDKELLIPYSLGLTQVYFWSYLGLTIAWACTVKRGSTQTKTMLEASTLITVFTFNFVLLMEAIYLILDYTGVFKDGFYGYMVIDKFSEVTSSIIIYRFILYLQPIFIVLNSDLSL